MKKNNWLFLTACLLIIAMAFTACSGSVTTTTTDDTKATETPAAEATEEKAAQEAAEEPEAKAAIPFEETFSFTLMSAGNEGEIRPVEQLIMDATNTDIEIIHVPGVTGDFLTKLNTVLASGNLPDVIYNRYNALSVGEWVKQGALIAVDDLLEEYGQDILAKYNEAVVMYATSLDDGKMYGVPGLNNFPYYGGMFIRQDWLDDLGLDSPVTVEDYINVYKAFIDQDANGNGKADEIGFATNGGIQDLDIWFWAYGIMAPSPHQISGSMSADMCEIVDGDMIPWFYNENYEECLANLNYMYEDGLIDPEYLVRDTSSVEELMSNGIISSVNWTGVPAKNAAVRETSGDADATYAWAAPPQGPYGDQYTMSRSPIGSTALITVQAEDPEKIMMYLNWLFTDEGILTTNFGKEGETFEYVDGEPDLLEPYCLGWSDNREYGMTKNDGFMCWVPEAFLQCAMQGKPESELDETGKLTYEGYVLNEPYAYVFPNLAAIYNAELNVEKAADVWVPIFTLQDQIIMGEKTFADMEALLAELDGDITEIITLFNEYYDILTGN